MENTTLALTINIFNTIDPEADTEKKARVFFNLLHTEALKKYAEIYLPKQGKDLSDHIKADISDEEAVKLLGEAINIEKYKSIFQTIATIRIHELLQAVKPNLDTQQTMKLRQIAQSISV